MDHYNENVGTSHKLGCKDARIIAYTGESASQNPTGGVTIYPNCPNAGTIGLYDYQKIVNNQPVIFTINGHYRENNGDKTRLSYDGHPGYDYPIEPQTGRNCESPQNGKPVFATASGTMGKVCARNNPGSSCTSANKEIGEVYLDHGYGLQSLYTHLCSSTVSQGQTVRKGEQIGWSGGAGANFHHLHFSTLWGITATRYMDPYGWKPLLGEPVQIDPYTEAKNVCIWESGCP